MHLVLCAWLVSLAAGSQDTSVLELLGPSPPTTTTEKDTTVKPTEKTSTFTNRNGEPCQCVPYFKCELALEVDHAWVTGLRQRKISSSFGERFEHYCRESVEVCCRAPKDEQEVPRPKPDPSKLRGCGYRNPQGLGGFTVTGGSDSEAQFGEFPWVVALLDYQNASYAGIGTLIHPQVVMTTAHIASKYSAGSLKIRAGEWDTQTIKEMLEYQERIVQEIYVHNEFNKKNLINDVALLQLQQPVQLAEHINVICLPGQNESFDTSRDCVANGWGKDKFGLQGRYVVILNRVKQNIVPHERCNMLLKRTRLGNRFKLDRSFLCAGEGEDSCKGDGGAPLACPIGDNRYKLTGLVAWGIGCGQKDVPAVYASVPAFRNWVDAKMNDWGYGTSTYTI